MVSQFDSSENSAFRISEHIESESSPSSPSLEMDSMRTTIKRVALYIRVSTSEQTADNQRRELDAVAQRHG
jgi:hypothetical protein